jgi:glycolate dehydrogenase FAD-linked subunit
VPESRPGALEALRAIVSEPVIEMPQSLERFQHDASTYPGRARAAVRPKDVEEVVRLVRWAREWHVPLVARGGGSSLEGESVPAEGAVVVDFGSWDRWIELDADDRLVRVGPGMINQELHRRLLPHRLFFPPNPGSWGFSTIGGNVATNASGMRSYRYGPTRAWVRGLEVVLGTGEVVRLGHRARKSSTGPGLLGFLVGSEGTLGLFTEVTLGLAPLPEERLGFVVPIPSEERLPSLVLRLAGAEELRISAIEYLDLPTARALAGTPGPQVTGEEALVLVEVESTTRERDRTLERTAELLEREGVGSKVDLVPSADALWTWRGGSSDALTRAHQVRLREDIAVPLPRLAEALREMRTIARQAKVEVFIYGHVGDGSLHPNFVVDPLSTEGRELRRRVLMTARRLGGTISAEHGIGLAKVPFLALEHGSTGVDLLRGLKQTFDPDGILNPGKLYPPASPAGAVPPAES